MLHVMDGGRASPLYRHPVREAVEGYTVNRVYRTSRIGLYRVYRVYRVYRIRLHFLQSRPQPVNSAITTVIEINFICRLNDLPHTAAVIRWKLLAGKAEEDEFEKLLLHSKFEFKLNQLFQNRLNPVSPKLLAKIAGCVR